MGFFKKSKCDICDQKFSKEEELMQHKQTVHFKDLPYDCKVCNETFSSMEDMRTHFNLIWPCVRPNNFCIIVPASSILVWDCI